MKLRSLSLLAQSRQLAPLFCGTLFLAGGPLARASLTTGFADDYAPANWISAATGSGNVDTGNAPDSVSLNVYGPGGGPNSIIDYSTTAAADGTVWFDWSCNNFLGQSAGYLVNGVYTHLPISDIGISSGSAVSFSVLANDTFGFRAESGGLIGFDNQLTISNFQAPATLTAVPEPGNLLVTGILLGGAGLFRFRPRRTHSA